MDRHEFAALDGLRGVAALAVVAFHAPNLLFGVETAGYLAVDLFFALSGFVLAHAYEARLKDGLGVRRFMVMRLIRLYPVYLVGTGIGLGLYLLSLLAGTPEFSGADLAVWTGLALLFLPAPAGLGDEGRNLFPLNPPAWSLFFELVANAAFAVAAPFLSTRILAVATGLFGIVLAVWAVAEASAADAPPLMRVSFSFFLGVLIYRFRGRAPRIPGAGWLAQGAVAAVLFFPEVGKAWQGVYDAAAVIMVFPLVLLIAAAARPGPRSRAIFSALGAISYPLYALHVPVFRWTYAAGGQAGVDIETLAPWPGLCLILALCATSLALDRWFDTPVRRWLNRRFVRRDAVRS